MLCISHCNVHGKLQGINGEYLHNTIKSPDLFKIYLTVHTNTWLATI